MTIIQGVQPYIALFVTAYILNGFISGESFADLLRFALIFLGIRFGLSSLEQFLHKVWNGRNEIAIRRIYLEKSMKYMHVDFELLDGPAINEINERIRRDNNWGGGFNNTTYFLSTTLSSIFGLIAGAIVMIPLFTESEAGGISLLMIGLFLFGLLASWINKKYFDGGVTRLLTDDSEETMKKYSTAYSSAFVFGGVGVTLAKVARLYKPLSMLKKYFDEEQPRQEAFGWKFTQYVSASAALSTFSAGLFTVFAYLFVVARSVAGVIPVGNIVFFAGAINEMAQRFFNAVSHLQGTIDQSDRLQSMIEFMELENKQYKGTLPVEKRRDGEYELEFKNVSFKYPGSEKYALKNFNMKLVIGQKLAIVGMNGSGKTTMIKLLTRLYDPTEGEITLNGVDVKKYDYKEYMKIFSVVFQDFKLLSLTIAENLTCGEELDNDAAVLAVDRVGFLERVNAMPDGFDTYLYNNYDTGVEVSGGEGQKLALARALYKNAPIIVLDEPTSALDPIAEFEVYSMFNDVITKRAENTAIFISHRLSSCRFCDDIGVFHEGELIQRGNHDTLIKDEKGKYFELWNAQAQYYKEETA